MPYSMDGIRDIKFTTGVGTLTLENTDFYVTYTAQRQGDQTELGMVLNEVWEHSDWDIKAYGLERRVNVEDRFELIQHTFVGQKGTLELDFNTPALKKTYTNITLNAVGPNLDDHNQLFEYNMEFLYPLSGLGSAAEIARTFKFGAYATVNALNFAVATLEEDRTVFKRVFRAAPMRVIAGPSLTMIKLLAIREQTTGGTDLAKRQDAESEIATWSARTGETGTLLVDGGSKGTCHLRKATPSDLELPDSVTYELEFLKDYST